MQGTLKDLTMNRDGSQNITVTVTSDFRAAFDELKDADVEIEIKKRYKRRSLSANAYAWVLIDKIAEKMGITKTEVYREAIRSIGGVSSIVCVQNKALQMLEDSWRMRGLGWFTEHLNSKHEDCTNLVLYYGSSVYDTKQMSDLVNHLVQDAEALGIPTMTENELERMVGAWRPVSCKTASGAT